MVTKSALAKEIPPYPARLYGNWRRSAARTETTLHQLSPYIGKIKSSIAASLISHFTEEGELVYDPFSGSGTVALEAWLAGRRVIANDLSPYAGLLTRAKLLPYKSLEAALKDIESVASAAIALSTKIDLRLVPCWVQKFFHTDTLREIVAWTTVLRKRRLHFLLSCLMGILHHQRPGFLSFPSSHTVPYLRQKNFPPTQFPELYQYRSLQDRLQAKVRRALSRLPELDFSISRRCFSIDSTKLAPSERVDAIITSPPYMRQLDYGRDNRLRLWFLGAPNWKALDKQVSPGEAEFLDLMRRCFRRWRGVLKPQGICVLVVGDACSRIQKQNLPVVVSRIATDEIGGYSLVCRHTEAIPDERRVRRPLVGNNSETILVLRNERANVLTQ